MTNKQLVLQTDFGLADGAVSTMYGVAKTVAPALHVADLTHEITTFGKLPIVSTKRSIIGQLERPLFPSLILASEANVKASVRSLKRVTMLLHQTTVPLRISPNFLV